MTVSATANANTTTSTSTTEVPHVHTANCRHEVLVPLVADDDEEDDGFDPNDTARCERKARRLLAKFGLKQVTKIERVTFRRGRSIFAIPAPIVYKTTLGSYVVFGDMHVEDPNIRSQMNASERLAAEAEAEGEEDEEEEEEEEQKEEGEDSFDYSGVDKKDVDIVVDQTGVSVEKAVEALKKNDNDIVNTIMELTM